MLRLTKKVKNILAQKNVTPIFILDVDGFPLFSSSEIYTYDNLGNLVLNKEALPYIDINRTTNSINQQLLIDKGGYSSASSFEICMVDVNEIVTKMITPSKFVEDILARKAKMYVTFDGAGHPKDSILLFSGIISEIKSGVGAIWFNLSSAEKLKSSELFPIAETSTTANINNAVTSVPVVDTKSFMGNADGDTLQLYIKLGDEIMKVVSKTDTSFDVIRAQFGTIAQSHDSDSDVSSFYRLKGGMTDLALKLMLSGGDEYFKTDIDILSANNYATLNIPNAIFLADYYPRETYGLVVGDIVNITNSSVPANNGEAQIVSIVTYSLGSYLVLDKTLTAEGAGAKASFKSKYNVLPYNAGLGMTPDQVDVQEFEVIQTQFGSRFFDYDFYIKDQKNGSEFINTQILYPSGCYSLPRKAKTSIGIMTPPLAKFGTRKLSNLNITKPGDIKINRSINKNFYNAIVYKYEMDPVDDEFIKGRIYQSAESTNRIKINNRPLTIEAEGVRNDGFFNGIFESQVQRFLTRYKFGAEFLDVNVTFSDGFNIEIGDTVILDGSKLFISDIKDGKGSRGLLPRLFEVQNKTMSFKSGSVQLSLVDTAFSLSGRYGVIGPSSRIDSIINPKTIKLKKTQIETIKNKDPQEKWENYIGEKILIHSKDWTWSQEVTLLNFPSSDTIEFTPSITGYPTGQILVVDTPKYEGNAENNALYKASHCFRNKTLVFNSMTNSSTIDLDATKIAFVKVGDTVFIHDKDYSNMSKVLRVESVNLVSYKITLSEPLTFTPQPEARIQLLSHVDGGAPYLWL